MTSIRSHTKSRLGCAQCKKRRIKCLGSPPACTNCVKKGIECDYKQWQPAIDQAQLLTQSNFARLSFTKSTPSRSPEATHGSPAESDLSTTAPVFSLQDLGLFHYFTIHTFETLPPIDSEHHRHLWQNEAPKLAQAHVFLAHAILAAGAGHRAADEEDAVVAASYLHTSRQHYSNAVAAFRSSVARLPSAGADGSLADAVLYFCIIIFTVTIKLDFSHTPVPNDAVSVFVTLLQTVQSSIKVLRQIRGGSHTSATGSLLGENRARPRYEVPPEITASLDRLETLIEQREASADMQMLADSLDKTRIFFTIVKPRPSSWAFMLSWIISLNPNFTRLVQNDDPIALAILAHFAAPVYHGPPRWFLGGWTTSLITTIQSRLPREWHPYIQWPLSETLYRTSEQQEADAQRRSSSSGSRSSSPPSAFAFALYLGEDLASSSSRDTSRTGNSFLQPGELENEFLLAGRG